ncbi:transcriptional regulator [Acidianus ambivalens]|uniref:Winged helix-turn-helix transcriptional regulator n=1 Tax=Acidianus ambivalens TaxID=2283 RepID=A0A650CTK8_ACIAM|nr:transcriptional regulator [Acidianus ambivalens]MQL56428.1 winged helix-turn-helix transcriptional regulator [Acidianus ambivalens]QGR21065.1 winged helix-turn-helix transcriptional regulator [Acidianus ambivalens]
MTYSSNEIRAKILRRKILQLIAENYILSASLISHTLLLSYATVLRHLRILNEEGLIDLYKQGRTLYAKIKENSKEIQILNSETMRFKKPLDEPVSNKNEPLVKIKDSERSP